MAALLDERLKAIADYPDISFIDGYTVARLEEDMLAWFKAKRKELTGEDITLSKADDRRILIQAGAYFIFQGYMYLDNAGKMGLLKYSNGDFLENLGALKHICRKEAKKATTTIRFHLKSARDSTVGIPRGTRLTSGDGVYFATDDYAEIAIGEMQADVGATCTAAGKAGNNYGAGEIKTIVDLVPFVDSAENITAAENGTDTEDDESLRERIYAAPAAYSSAGTADAYAYFVRAFSSDIGDVSITSPASCKILVRFLLEDGTIPESESLNALQAYLSAPEIKPITDQIEVKAPELVPYRIEMKYYINSSDKNRANVIQGQVMQALEGYKMWQKSRMGRDINPSELVRQVMAAGAKRVDVAAPAFAVVPDGAVASLDNESIVYGGLEDD